MLGEAAKEVFATRLRALGRRIGGPWKHWDLNKGVVETRILTAKLRGFHVDFVRFT